MGGIVLLDIKLVAELADIADADRERPRIADLDLTG